MWEDDNVANTTAQEQLKSHRMYRHHRQDLIEWQERLDKCKGVKKQQ